VHFSLTDSRVRDVPEFILQLYSTSGKPWQVKTFASSNGGVTKCSFNQTIHSAVTFVFTVGQNEETAS